MMRKLLLFTVLTAATAPLAMAQSTAVRFILGEGHKVYTDPSFGNYCMGLGLDRSFNTKLTAGIDIAFDVIGAFGGEAKYVYAYTGNTTTEYLVEPKLFSLNYHTEYALGDDGGTHLYIGTFLGLRRISQQWRSSGYFSSSTYVETPVDLKVSKWLVPVGLRMGLRGATDGGFMDLYVAGGYQLGGGKSCTGIAKLKGAAYDDLSAFALTLGWAYGIGW